MPGGDDLDDLIDSYVADAMRATGIPAERRAKPTYAPPPAPIEAPAPELEPAPAIEPAEPVPVRTKAPTPTGVARLAAELFDDLVDDVAPPPPPSRPPPPPPQAAGGVSIRFSQSHAIPLEPPEPPLSELYVMPLRPSPVEEPAVPASRVPDTLPGMGPPRFSAPSAGFSSDLPTDPDAGALGIDHDDEPTNVVTRPEP